MENIASINHVTLIVDNLEESAKFYENELGLEPLPAFIFDYPAAFFKVNDTQQIHLSEWDDAQSIRGHVCLNVKDFDTLFKRFKALNIIDTEAWGGIKKMPDGSMQMFVRDPANNLVELVSFPDAEVDPAIFEDELFQKGIYVSGRNDFRGYKSDKATLHHDENA